MSKTVGVELTPIIVEAVGEAQKNIYPTPSDGKISLRNDHLNYAITWFSLALIGLVMFAIYHRQPKANITGMKQEIQD
jgi:surfeit locus 1 family protein